MCACQCMAMWNDSEGIDELIEEKKYKNAIQPLRNTNQTNSSSFNTNLFMRICIDIGIVKTTMEDASRLLYAHVIRIVCV